MQSSALRGTRVAVAVGLAMVALLPTAVRAGTDPRLAWQTLEGEHFHVHFHTGLYLEAVHALEMAEHAHAVLSPLFDYHPREICHIVVRDTTDSSNGSATPYLYNQINLYASRPDDTFGSSDDGDWFENLILHEYAHIVHMDTVEGLPKLFNAIFGKVWLPNGAVPPWYLEGFATAVESRETTVGGRARSAFVDMYLRMAILTDTFPKIDEMSSGVFVWPRGNMRYYYGGRFLAWLWDRFGSEKIAEFHRRYARRPVPFAVNIVAKDTFGKDFVTLYHDWIGDLTAHYEAVRDEVMAAGFRSGDPITHTGEGVRDARFSPDGTRIAFYNADALDPSHLRIVNADGTEPRDYAVVRRSYRVPAWFPDGRSLVLMRVDAHRNFYNYTDLYRFDIPDRRLTRLSHGLRARFPHVSHDGEWIVFERKHGGSNDLAMMRRDGTDLVTLIEHVRFESVHNPEFSPDGKRIAFSIRKDFRVEIALYTLADGSFEWLTDDSARDEEPTWSPDGRHLFFSSDRNGIFNIYACELATGRLWQVTNVLGGALQPDVSSDGKRLLYRGYGTKGFDLFVMELRPETWTEVPLHDPDLPPRAHPRGERESLASLATRMLAKVKRYAPWRTLLPKHWAPMLGNDAYGTTIGLTTGADDAARLHSWSAAIELGLVSLAPSWSLLYRYRGFYPTLSLSGRRSTSARSDLRIDGVVVPYVEERYSFSVAASFPFNFTDGDHSVTVRYDGAHIAADEPVEVILDPGDREPRFPDSGFLGGIALSWRWSNARPSTYSVSKEEGRSLAASLRVRDRVLGSEFRSVEFTARWQEYIENPLVENHILAFRLEGGIAAGDFRVRRAFRVGGTPAQDVLMAMVNQSSIGAGYLRGYERSEFVGDRYYLASFEYRFPIKIIDRGLWTLPLAVTRVYGLVFFDIGTAFDEPGDALRPFPSVGTEAVLEIRIAWQIAMRFRFGIAEALAGIGDPERRRTPKVYAFVGSSF